MSSLEVPPVDNRSLSERLADSWYGQQGEEVGSYRDFLRSFIQTNPQRANELLAGSWSADMPSQFSSLSALPGVGRFVGSPTDPIGYIRFNTGPGNESKDAIFTVLANNLGVDNAIRASMAREEGDYGTWAKELATGAIEVYVTARSTGGQVVGRTVTRGIGGIINAVRRAPVRTGGAPLPPITGQSLSGIAAQTGGTVPYGTVATRAGGYTLPVYGPTPVTVARTGPRGVTTLPGRAVDATANLLTRFGNAGIGGTVSAIGRRLAPSRLPGGRFGAVLGLAGLAAAASQMRPGSQPAPTATELGAEVTPTPRDVPPLVRGSVSPEADAANNARIDIEGINQQYGNILRELQGMYQLSETEEEKERLRFMLADIEAQRDAGLQAIAEGYTRTVGQIREQATLAGERTTERAQRYGADLEASADRAAQRMMLQNTQQQQQFRGLGSGSQAPVNEWVGLMSAMAPAQQLYTQRMGDISREGMEWLANTVGAQGQAQGADLQRLAAATRSGTIARQQQQVSDRINRERELQRAAILDTLQRQAGAVGSANQINAGISAQPSAADISAFIEQMITGPNVTVDDVQQAMYSRNYGDLTPAQRAYVDRLRSLQTASTNNPPQPGT